MLVPNRYLFRFEFPLRYRESPRIDGSLDEWSDKYRLPELSPLDGLAPWATFYAGWNEGGLYVAAHVRGRKTPFQCNPKQFWKGDNFRVMTDMRNTRDIKRGSRYCQQFYFLPAGATGAYSRPVAGAAKVMRATEDAPVPDSELIKVAANRDGASYVIEGHIPAEALHGFDPAEHPRIGLYLMIEDKDLGQQYLTVGDDLYWYIDPSAWPTAILERPA